PGLVSAAPVNAPFSYPNSSDSSSSSGSDAQSIVIYCDPRLRLRSCIWRATTSLPVPDSPNTRTLASVAATRSISSATLFIAADFEKTPIARATNRTAPSPQPNQKICHPTRPGFLPSLSFFYAVKYYALGVPPQSLEIVELPGRGVENVHNEIAVV